MRKRLLDYIRYLTEECGKEHTREEWEALQADLLVLLVPYIWHYYVLENGTQTLYSFYDTTVEKLK